MARASDSPRALDALAAELADGDAMQREQAVRELGESGDPRAVRYLIAALRDDSPAVAVAAVRALERLNESSAMLPLYELVQNELADPHVREVAAEALVRFGLLRRERRGPSTMFMWLAGLALVVVAVGAASSLGAWAVVLFVVGVGALGAFALRQRRQAEEGVYIGPNGERIRLRRARSEGTGGDDGTWFDFDGIDV